MRPFFIFPAPKNIEVLESKLKLRRANNSPRDLREKIQIAVIDDKDFQPLVNLTNHGFNLKHFPDINDISAVHDFQIILCDLQGVGTFLNPTEQGAHLIRELKINSPEKYIISYTGGSSNSNITRLGNQFADSYIKKDADIATWQDKLDEAIYEVTDPVIVWKKFRGRLLEKYDLNLLDVIQFENAYVRACLNNTDESPEKEMRNALKCKSLTYSNKAVEEFLTSSVLKIAIQLAKHYVGANYEQ